MTTLMLPVFYSEDAILKGRRKPCVVTRMEMVPFEIEDVEENVVGSINTLSGQYSMIDYDDSLYVPRRHTDSIDSIQKKIDKTVRLWSDFVRNEKKGYHVNNCTYSTMKDIDAFLDAGIYNIYRDYNRSNVVLPYNGNYNRTCDEYINIVSDGDDMIQSVSNNFKHKVDEIREHMKNLVLCDGKLFKKSRGFLEFEQGFLNPSGLHYRLLTSPINDIETCLNVIKKNGMPSGLMSILPAHIFMEDGKYAKTFDGGKKRREFECLDMEKYFDMDMYLRNMVALNLFRLTPKDLRNMTMDTMDCDVVLSIAKIIQARRDVCQDVNAIPYAMETLKQAIETIEGDKKLKSNVRAGMLNTLKNSYEKLTDIINQVATYQNRTDYTFKI